jgi:V/A-type H+-transporting ATPase subunit B
MTREDHLVVANQLYASYSKVEDVRGLAGVIGEEELSPLDRQVLEFGSAFEQRFMNQAEDENRTIGETLDLAWDILGILPRSELARMKDDVLDKYYHRQGEEDERG